jgi:hypothetical protein
MVYLRFCSCRHSEKTKGLCPLNPKVYRFCFQEGSKKGSILLKMPPSRKPYVPLRSLLSVALSCT